MQLVQQRGKKAAAHKTDTSHRPPTKQIPVVNEERSGRKHWMHVQVPCAMSDSPSRVSTKAAHIRPPAAINLPRCPLPSASNALYLSTELARVSSHLAPECAPSWPSCAPQSSSRSPLPLQNHCQPSGAAGPQTSPSDEQPQRRCCRIDLALQGTALFQESGAPDLRNAHLRVWWA